MDHAAPALPAAFEGASVGCLVCGGSELFTRWKGLLGCKTCGFVFADLKLSGDELARIYGHDYFNGGEYFDYGAEEESLRGNFRDRLRDLSRISPDLSARDLLEIGCAYGFFLDEARHAFKSVAGIDISKDAVRHAREQFGLDAQHGDYLALDVGRKFGTIAMWDTIEHLNRPDLFIEKASADLSPGGLLAVTTGDIGSLNARLRGAKWRMIHPPTHLHYFSVDTISRLLRRHGFEIVHVSHPGNARNLRSIFYYLFAWGHKESPIYKSLLHWRGFDLRITVNLFDIMFVVARRR
ncbi:MAG: class I SAM-dependent methyltransferase [Alphaproteobacteria bacterium]|nr:class I SAM-dependent methyltransferase [Alphaproteobacteria bacterium]